MLISDGISPEEADPDVLSKYVDWAKTKFSTSREDAADMISEALAYIRIKNADMDPLSEGKKFGFGFS